MGEDKPTKVIDDNLLIIKVFEHEIIMVELQREIEQLKRNIEKLKCDRAKKNDNNGFYLLLIAILFLHIISYKDYIYKY